MSPPAEIPSTAGQENAAGSRQRPLRSCRNKPKAAPDGLEPHAPVPPKKPDGARKKVTNDHATLAPPVIHRKPAAPVATATAVRQLPSYVAYANGRLQQPASDESHDKGRVQCQETGSSAGHLGPIVPSSPRLQQSLSVQQRKNGPRTFRELVRGNVEIPTRFRYHVGFLLPEVPMDGSESLMNVHECALEAEKEFRRCLERPPENVMKFIGTHAKCAIQACECIAWKYSAAYDVCACGHGMMTHYGDLVMSPPVYAVRCLRMAIDIRWLRYVWKAERHPLVKKSLETVIHAMRRALARKTGLNADMSEILGKPPFEQPPLLETIYSEVIDSQAPGSSTAPASRLDQDAESFFLAAGHWKMEIEQAPDTKTYLRWLALCYLPQYFRSLECVGICLTFGKPFLVRFYPHMEKFVRYHIRCKSFVVRGNMETITFGDFLGRVQRFMQNPPIQRGTIIYHTPVNEDIVRLPVVKQEVRLEARSCNPKKSSSPRVKKVTLFTASDPEIKRILNWIPLRCPRENEDGPSVIQLSKNRPVLPKQSACRSFEGSDPDLQRIIHWIPTAPYPERKLGQLSAVIGKKSDSLPLTAQTESVLRRGVRKRKLCPLLAVMLGSPASEKYNGEGVVSVVEQNTRCKESSKSVGTKEKGVPDLAASLRGGRSFGTHVAGRDSDQRDVSALPASRKRKLEPSADSSARKSKKKRMNLSTSRAARRKGKKRQVRSATVGLETSSIPSQNIHLSLAIEAKRSQRTTGISQVEASTEGRTVHVLKPTANLQALGPGLEQIVKWKARPWDAVAFQVSSKIPKNLDPGLKRILKWAPDPWDPKNYTRACMRGFASQAMMRKKLEDFGNTPDPIKMTDRKSVAVARIESLKELANSSTPDLAAVIGHGGVQRSQVVGRSLPIVSASKRKYSQLPMPSFVKGVPEEFSSFLARRKRVKVSQVESHRQSGYPDPFVIRWSPRESYDFFTQLKHEYLQERSFEYDNEPVLTTLHNLERLDEEYARGLIQFKLMTGTHEDLHLMTNYFEGHVHGERYLDRLPKRMKVMAYAGNTIRCQLRNMDIEHIADVMTDSSHETLVMLRKDEVVGTVVYTSFPFYGFIEIVFLAIDMQHHMKGFGAYLMNHLKDIAANSGIKAMLTYADLNATDYFLKMGFQEEMTPEEGFFFMMLKFYTESTPMVCRVDDRVMYSEWKRVTTFMGRALDKLADNRNMRLKKIGPHSGAGIVMNPKVLVDLKELPGFASAKPNLVAEQLFLRRGLQIFEKNRELAMTVEKRLDPFPTPGENLDDADEGEDYNPAPPFEFKKLENKGGRMRWRPVRSWRVGMVKRVVTTQNEVAERRAKRRMTASMSASCKFAFFPPNRKRYPFKYPRAPSNLPELLFEVLQTLKVHPDAETVRRFDSTKIAHGNPGQNRCMDLEEISKRMARGYYKHVHPFMVDIRRMFSNQRTYNEDKDCAERLTAVYLAKMNQVFGFVPAVD